MVRNGPDLLWPARKLVPSHCPINNPLDHKVRDAITGVSHGLAEVGYDIRLKQDVKFDPEHLYAYSETTPRARVAVSDEEGEMIFRDGRFAIASAMEEFDMPTDLVGIVHDKSTWARRGLSVFNTVIEPGWRGFLTLELVYHGNQELHIPAGTGIAQVIFHEISVPNAYEGKYQDQADEPVEAIFSRGLR